MEMVAERLKLFRPEIKFYELEYFLKRKEITIRNDFLYKLAEKLTNIAYPSYKDKFEKRWEYFYLPSKRSGKTISIPFAVTEYRRKFYVHFHRLGQLSIGKGKERIESIYRKILNEAIRFVRIIEKTNGEIVRRTVPYDFRTGKVKGKFIMNKLMPKREKKKILADYKKHVEKGLKVSEISLNEYLRVASICYRAAYRKKAKAMSYEEMYRKWADGRDDGMLSIKNKSSKKEFMEWLRSGGRIGHPFEIVFSWFEHGIHLYPPDKEQPHFSIRVTNYGYVDDFIKMVKALIKENVPFVAREINKVLEYLAGESYFTVNDYDEHFFFYIPSKEYKDLYFHHIEWDELKVVRFK